MSDFWLYFKLGLEHVLDWNAYDHVLFIIVLTAIYTLESWKRLLWLVTLFTIGHTVSLFLTNYNIVDVSSKWIEFFIPITIMVTALHNLVVVDKRKKENKNLLLYAITLFFGLIHGFGFGRYFNQINDEQQLLPLLEFALGIEMAQLIVVLIVLLVSWSLRTFIKLSLRDWIVVISAIVLGMSIPMLVENWAF